MSMTDRELLELAAIAAGEDVEWLKTEKAFFRRSCSWPQEKGWFNPLHDDGEALRLAVTLKMQIIVHGDWVEAMIDGIQLSSPASCYSADGCLYETTRRAIVRAAAEIGKSMQEVSA